MNIDPNDMTGPDAGRHEAEWQAQEQALRDERRGLPLSTQDARLAEYRLISRALRHAPLDPVPFDFARAVAARASATVDTDDGMERLLLRVLSLAMAVAGAVVAAIYGAQWGPAVAGALPLPAGELLRWGLVLAACAGMTWMLGQVLRSEPLARA